ncbi:MAG TPA: hypothetical protein VFC99_18020 [Acidimicrobiia bacterium]|nr:hypothetical protein [Acidimicrobiia bacterium]
MPEYASVVYTLPVGFEAADLSGWIEFVGGVSIDLEAEVLWRGCVPAGPVAWRLAPGHPASADEVTYQFRMPYVPA